MTISTIRDPSVNAALSPPAGSLGLSQFGSSEFLDVSVAACLAKRSARPIPILPQSKQHFVACLPLESRLASIIFPRGFDLVLRYYVYRMRGSNSVIFVEYLLVLDVWHGFPLVSAASRTRWPCSPQSPLVLCGTEAG